MSDAPLRIHQPYEELAVEGAPRTSDDEAPQAPTDLNEADPGWRSHPINIRVSVPLGFGRWYFTLVGGSERRDPNRRKIERQRHPLFTLGNLVFLFSVGAVIGVAVAVLMINGAVQLLDGSYSVVTP